MFIAGYNLINVLILITIILFIVQIVYLLSVYNLHFINRKKVYDDNITPPLSVIVVVTNINEKIESNLKSLLEQDYPDFEVIVVYEQINKLIEDELIRIKNQYSNLYITFIPETARYISHKKLGITIGIKASKNDILIFTEPDAHPVSNQWLRKIARNFTEGTDFVFGYSNYEINKNWFNRVIIFDRLKESLKYLGMAINKMPYKASGYNLAYRKSIFYKNNGFNKHLNLQRGEDDLFVNEYAKSKNTKVEISAESVVRIDNPSTRTDWVMDKLSAYNTQKYYKGFGISITKIFNSLITLFNIVALIALLLTFYRLEWHYFAVIVGLILLQFIIQTVIIFRVCSKLNERSYILSYFIINIYLKLANIKIICKKVLTNKKDFLRR